MCISAMVCELKNKKKLDGACTAALAFSAASMAATEVIPLLPSCAGQSLWFRTSTGITCHQIAGVVMSLLATTWLWFGVGKKTLAVGGGMMPRAANTGPRSSREACMVHVPGLSL